MAVLQECPICKTRISLKHKKCKRCGENIEKARRSKRVNYYVQYKIEGKQYSECFHNSLENAKAADGKIKAKRKEGNILDIVPESKITFQELTDWYLSLRSVQKLRSLKRVKGALKNFNMAFGKKLVSDIKPYQLEEYQENRLDEGRSEATIDMEISIAQTVVNKGLDNEIIYSEGVLRTFRKIKRKLKPRSNVRDRIISPEEYETLIENSPGYLKYIFSTAYYTGMRLTEILTMTWERTNLKKCYFELDPEHTKDKESRIVPICKSLLEILENMPKCENSDFVFLYKGEPIKDVRKGLRLACERSGITYGRFKKGGFIFHDFRHTFNTNMRKAGVSESVIMEITGHSTRDMFDRYNTIDFEDLKKATISMESFLNS